MKTMAIVVLCALSALAAAPAPSLFDEAILFGPTFDISERQGRLDFGNGVTEELSRGTMVNYGIVAGKRFALGRNLRLQLFANFKYGSALDDTVPADAELADSTIMRRTLMQGGIIADLQLPLILDPQSSAESRFYVHAGGGLHLATMSESEVYVSDQSQTVSGDPYVEPSHTAVSVSMHGGLGYEFMSSPTFGMAFEGTIRYWYPVHYEMTRDLFPLTGIPYNEQWISWEFNVLFLVK